VRPFVGMAGHLPGGGGFVRPQVVRVVCHKIYSPTNPLQECCDRCKYRRRSRLSGSPAPGCAGRQKEGRTWRPKPGHLRKKVVCIAGVRPKHPLEPPEQ